MSYYLKAENIAKVYPSRPSILDTSRSLLNILKNQISSPKISQLIAVDDVSLNLAPGDRLGIIGRNGAGKSTLLGILAGLIAPTSGNIEVQGRITAVMTLGLGLRDDLSGRENIYIDGEIQGKSREEINNVIDDVIAFADIGEFIDYPLRTYSTGMKARLAFAMISNIDPEILIIDEALSVGDAKFSQKATRKIQEICRRGKIVIIVSHGLQSVVEMCNRCIWMEKGQIIMEGSPAEVTAAYQEAVRKEDEFILQEKFYRHMDVHSLQSDCAIMHLNASRSQVDEAQTIFNTGDPFQLQFDIAVGQLNNPDICIRIQRLDGLVVSESWLSDVKDKALIQPGKHHYQVSLPQLALAAGIFKVTVELLNEREVMATRSIIIEVQTLNMPSGGRPLLIYPSMVSVKQNADRF